MATQIFTAPFTLEAGDRLIIHQLHAVGGIVEIGPLTGVQQETFAADNPLTSFSPPYLVDNESSVDFTVKNLSAARLLYGEIFKGINAA